MPRDVRIRLPLAQFRCGDVESPISHDRCYGAALVNEILRYAGAVHVDEKREVLEIPLPPGHNARVWLQQNLDRIRSFLYTAEAVGDDVPARFRQRKTP